MELRDAIESMNLKFTSANDIPVTRTNITREEWEAIKAKINEASVDVPPVRRSLPRLEELLHFIDGDRIEIKLYGNDGFDGQEILDGREYLKKWIAEAVEEARGNDR